MEHDYSIVFETDNEYWQRVLDIFAKNEHYPKRITKNRNLHHKFPKSFSKKLGQPIDNDTDNLISLSLPEHFLIHYYYYLLAKKGFRGLMATAFRFMARTTIKYLTPETVESMALDYERMNEVANQYQSLVIKQKYRDGEYANRRKLTQEELKIQYEKSRKTFKANHNQEEINKINYEKGKSLRGKSYEEAYGIEKALELKQKRIESNRKRDYSKFKKIQPSILIKCIETGEVHYMGEWAAILNCKSKSAICNVLDKANKTCRKLHFIRISEKCSENK